MKIINILLIIICLLIFASCGTQGEEENNNEPAVEPIEEVRIEANNLLTIQNNDEVTCGGWTNQEEELTEETIKYFYEAVKYIDGVSYTPIKILSKQVVAGMNYEYLCEATITSTEPETKKKIMRIFVDLEGNCEITYVQDY